MGNRGRMDQEPSEKVRMSSMQPNIGAREEREDMGLKCRNKQEKDRRTGASGTRSGNKLASS